MKNIINNLKTIFSKQFNNEPELLFVSRGRFEIVGNHTDHNHGKCISARCDKAIYASVRKNNDNIIRLHSLDNNLTIVDLNDLSFDEKEVGSSNALVRGMCFYLKEQGYKICGFDAITFSTIPAGSGLSSSAAFETLIGNIINYYANNNVIDKVTIAKAGQFAENKYFNKACGLLDQISVAYPAIKYIDFKNIENPEIKIDKFPFDLKVILVNTKGSHAGLDKEYSSIPELMYSAAKKLGVNYLRETTLQHLYELKNSLTGDEFDKSLHFFNENLRVENTLEAIKNKDLNEFLNNVNESCTSSATLLKNTMLDCLEDSPQEVIDFVKTINPNGAVKINGGGFKGTVVIFVRKENYEHVKEQLFVRYNDQIIETEIDNDGKDFYLF